MATGVDTNSVIADMANVGSELPLGEVYSVEHPVEAAVDGCSMVIIDIIEVTVMLDVVAAVALSPADLEVWFDPVVTDVVVIVSGRGSKWGVSARPEIISLAGIICIWSMLTSEDELGPIVGLDPYAAPLLERAPIGWAPVDSVCHFKSAGGSILVREDVGAVPHEVASDPDDWFDSFKLNGARWTGLVEVVETVKSVEMIHCDANTGSVN